MLGFIVSDDFRTSSGYYCSLEVQLISELLDDVSWLGISGRGLALARALGGPLGAAFSVWVGDRRDGRLFMGAERRDSNARTTSIQFYWYG